MHEARLSVWLLILPSLGYNYHRIEETVDFARPAELVAAIELAIYRNRDEEGRQLKQERLDELIYMGVMNADHLPDDQLVSPVTDFYLFDTTPNEKEVRA